MMLQTCLKKLLQLQISIQMYRRQISWPLNLHAPPASLVPSVSHVYVRPSTWSAGAVGDASSCHFAKLRLASLNVYCCFHVLWCHRGKFHLPNNTRLLKKGEMAPRTKGENPIVLRSRICKQQIVPTIMEKTLRDDQCLEAGVIPWLVFVFFTDSFA